MSETKTCGTCGGEGDCPDCWGAERWIEVWPDPDCKSVDVMTRQGDDVTHAMADGLARLLALTWTGKVESG